MAKTADVPRWRADVSSSWSPSSSSSSSLSSLWRTAALSSSAARWTTRSRPQRSWSPSTTASSTRWWSNRCTWSSSTRSPTRSSSYSASVETASSSGSSTATGACTAWRTTSSSTWPSPTSSSVSSVCRSHSCRTSFRVSDCLLPCCQCSFRVSHCSSTPSCRISYRVSHCSSSPSCRISYWVSHVLLPFCRISFKSLISPHVEYSLGKSLFIVLLSNLLSFKFPPATRLSTHMHIILCYWYDYSHSSTTNKPHARHRFAGCANDLCDKLAVLSLITLLRYRLPLADRAANVPSLLKSKRSSTDSHEYYTYVLLAGLVSNEVDLLK